MSPFKLLNVFFFSFIFVLKAHSASCFDAIIIGSIKAGGLQSYNVKDIQNSPLLPHQKTLFSTVAEAGKAIRQHYDAAPHASAKRVPIYIDPRHSALSADGFNRMKVYAAYSNLKTLVDTKSQELEAHEENIYDLFYDNLKPGAEPPDHIELSTRDFFDLLEKNSNGMLNMVADPLIRIEILASITKHEHLHDLYLQSREECEATHELYLFLDEAQNLSAFIGWLNKLFSLHNTYFEAQEKVIAYIDSASEEEMTALRQWMMLKE